MCTLHIEQIFLIFLNIIYVYTHIFSFNQEKAARKKRNSIFETIIINKDNTFSEDYMFVASVISRIVPT